MILIFKHHFRLKMKSEASCRPSVECGINWYIFIRQRRNERSVLRSQFCVGSGCSYFRKTTATTALRHASADGDARGDYISISTITLFTAFHSLPAESVKSSGMPDSPCLGTNRLAWPG